MKKLTHEICLGMKDACEWLISCFEDVIEDLADDESDVPIVPLAEHAIQAIENDIFQRLLIALGAQRPVEFQVRLIGTLIIIIIGRALGRYLINT